MIGRFMRVSGSKVGGVISRPHELLDYAYPEDGSDADPSMTLDIDKSWHLIHFLIAGQSWGGQGAIADAVLGGEEITDTDAGYGPFRYLLPDQVRATAKELSSLSAAELWGRFDAGAAAAAEIYPQPWTGEDPEREYITRNYEELRRFYSDAAESGDAMLLYIS